MDLDLKQIAFISIAVLLLIGFGVFAQFGSLSVASISEIEFDSNSDFWDGEAIVVNWIEDGSTDSLNVQLGDEIESETGYEANELTIDAVVTDVQANYDYRESSEVRDPRDYGGGDLIPIFEYSAVGTDSFFPSPPDDCVYLPGGPYQNFETENDPEDPAIVQGAGGQYYCYNDSDLRGNVYSLSSPDVTVTTEFEIDIQDGPTYTETISTSMDEQGSTFITSGGEVVGHIEWVGNLDDGHNFPSPSDENIMVFDSANFDDLRWFIDQDNYDAYRNYMLGGLGEPQALDDLIAYATSQSLGMEDLNQKISDEVIGMGANEPGAVLNERSDSAIWEGGDGFYDGGYAVTEAGGAIPQYVVTLDAEDIIVSKTVGQPEVGEFVSPPTPLNDDGSVQVNEGQASTIEYEVTNIGDEEGLFTGEVSCQGDFASESPQDSINLNSGETGTMSHEITFESDQVETEDCSVQVYDSADPTIIDSKSFEVTGDPDAVCFPQDGYRPDGTDIVFCDNDGEEVVASGDEPAGYVSYTNFELDGNEYVFETVDGEISIPEDDAYINDETEDSTWANTVVSFEIDDSNGGSGWFSDLTESLGLPTPGGGESYADDCMIYGFVNPGCAIAAGVDGLVDATEDAVALFDAGFGLLVSIVTGGFLYSIYREYSEGMNQTIAATLAIGILLFSLLIGFLAFQWIQGWVPKIVILSVLLIGGYIKMAVPGL